MQIVSVRYSEVGGGLTHKLAEVLNDHPGLDTLRVRILTTGQVRHVHRNSVINPIGVMAATATTEISAGVPA